MQKCGYAFIFMSLFQRYVMLMKLYFSMCLPVFCVGVSWRPRHALVLHRGAKVTKGKTLNLAIKLVHKETYTNIIQDICELF